MIELISGDKPYFADARRHFHAALLESGVLAVSEDGIPSNADGSQKSSVKFATYITQSIKVETSAARLPGQSSGGRFEQACADFVRATFGRLGMLRPGDWSVVKITGRKSVKYIAQFEQYSHLRDLDIAVKKDRDLQAILGNAYLIAPDVVVSRSPVDDSFINRDTFLVDDEVARGASIRRINQQQEILHAVISCKWTLRSDRAQNARSEALNLIRNRKGRLPHVVVVTGEPSPSRIASLALGTGDVDCVYHFALPELLEAVEQSSDDEAEALLRMMVQGKRLRDIADLPLDLAI